MRGALGASERLAALLTARGQSSVFGDVVFAEPPRRLTAMQRGCGTPKPRTAPHGAVLPVPISPDPPGSAERCAQRGRCCHLPALRGATGPAGAGARRGAAGPIPASGLQPAPHSPSLLRPHMCIPASLRLCHPASLLHPRIPLLSTWLHPSIPPSLHRSAPTSLCSHIYPHILTSLYPYIPNPSILIYPCLLPILLSYNPSSHFSYLPPLPHPRIPLPLYIPAPF